jgi:hypothetical protein
MADSNTACIAAALEARRSYLTEDETSELLELVTVLGSTMESIVEDMRQEVAHALERENETENHPQIAYELTQNQLAGI